MERQHHVEGVHHGHCRALLQGEGRDHARHHPGRCKPFGEQICVLIIDTWWGWLNIVPWPVGQAKVPMDPAHLRASILHTGGAANGPRRDRQKLKAIVRRMYKSWVISLVTAQLGAGKPAGEVKVPSDVPSCKTNLFGWLSLAVDELNKDPAGIVHCWKETELVGTQPRGTGGVV